MNNAFNWSSANAVRVSFRAPTILLLKAFLWPLYGNLTIFSLLSIFLSALDHGTIAQVIDHDWLRRILPAPVANIKVMTSLLF